MIAHTLSATMRTFTLCGDTYFYVELCGGTHKYSELT